jgi:hypothetical protein
MVVIQAVTKSFKLGKHCQIQPDQIAVRMRQRLSKACALRIECPGAVLHITGKRNENRAIFRNDDSR